MTIQFKSDFFYFYLFIYFFFFGGGGGTNSLILSEPPKQGIPEKNHLTTCKAELGLSHMWPELGLNPQWWDNDERFRPLQISVPNHSAIVGTLGGGRLKSDLKA